MEIDFELSWHELAEMAWWEAHPEAAEDEFNAALVKGL